MSKRASTKLNKRLAVALFIAAGTLSALLAGASAYVAARTRPARFADTASVPSRPVAIVFGAGLMPDGTPSPMLADRIDAAIALYDAGKVRKLLMSGDNSSVDYNEVEAMRRYAEARGVPHDDIALDYAGFNTYATCFRAKAIFGVTRAVLVTQAYHLPRAVYTCGRLGIDAVGVGTPDYAAYGMQTILPYAVREVVATANAMLDVNFIHPEPVLGKVVGLTPD